MITKAQKKLILKAFKMIDPKKIEVEMVDERSTKWFRFGAYSGLQMAAQIVKQLPEETEKKAA